MIPGQYQRPMAYSAKRAWERESVSGHSEGTRGRGRQWQDRQCRRMMPSSNVKSSSGGCEGGETTSSKRHVEDAGTNQSAHRGAVQARPPSALNATLAAPRVPPSSTGAQLLSCVWTQHFALTYESAGPLVFNAFWAFSVQSHWWRPAPCQISVAVYTHLRLFPSARLPTPAKRFICWSLAFNAIFCIAPREWCPCRLWISAGLSTSFCVTTLWSQLVAPEFDS